jgi:hypothetical protein
MRKLTILTIVSLVTATALAACFTQCHFDANPMELHQVEDYSIDWSYVLMVFTCAFGIFFCGSMFFGSIPLVVIKLFRWLRPGLAGSPPVDESAKPDA